MMLHRKTARTAAAWSVALMMASPIIWMALTAFKTDLEASRFPPSLVFQPTLENVALAGASLARPTLNSVAEAVGATGLCFLLGFPAAYALAFGEMRARNTILLGMLATRLTPGIGVMIPIYLIFKAVGLIDTLVGLALVFALTNLPIVVWLLFSSMREIPREILESARLDGATPKQQLLLILLPLCAPGLCSTALLSVILCWNEAFWSVQLTSSAGMPVSAFVGTLSGDLLWAKFSASSLLAVGPILLIGWAAQRQLVRGLTFGAVR